MIYCKVSAGRKGRNETRKDKREKTAYIKSKNIWKGMDGKEVDPQNNPPLCL